MCRAMHVCMQIWHAHHEAWKILLGSITKTDFQDGAGLSTRLFHELPQALSPPAQPGHQQHDQHLLRL
jgi:hypothetical protein